MAKNSRNAEVQVDITGDPSELRDSLQQSEKNIESFGKRVTNSIARVAQSFEYLNQLPSRVISIITSKLKAVLDYLVQIGKASGALNQEVSTMNNAWENGISLLSAYIGKLQNSWEVQKDLSLAVRLTGQSAGYTAEELNKYAIYLEKVTEYEKDATKAAQQILLHFRDIRGDQFLDATKAAQDMAKALKLDLATAAQDVGFALQNPIQAFERLEQRNVFFTEREKKTILQLLETNQVVDAQRIVLDKLNASFGGAAQTAGDSFAGTLTKVKNRLTTVSQTITEHLLNALGKLTQSTVTGESTIEAYVKKIESLVPAVNKLIDEWIPKIVELAEVVKGKLITAFGWLLEKSVYAFSVAQTAYENFGRIVKVVTDSVQVILDKLRINFKIIWEQVLPASLRYFDRVMDEILTVKLPNAVDKMLNYIGAATMTGFKWLTKNAAIAGGNMMIAFIEGAINKATSQGPVIQPLLKKLGLDFNVAKLDRMEYEGLEDYKKSFDEEYKKAEEFSEKNFRKKPKNSLEAPDFAKMFERPETDREKELKKEIQDLKKTLSDDLDTNNKDNLGRLDAVKTRLQELIKESERADEAFRKEFGAKVKEPNLVNNASKDYDRQEAKDRLAREKKEQEERDKNKKSQEDSLHNSVIGLEEMWHKVSSGADSEAEITKKNTEAIRENTRRLQDIRKVESSKKSKDEIKRAQAIRRQIARPAKPVMSEAQKQERKRQLQEPLRLGKNLKSKPKPTNVPNAIKRREQRTKDVRKEQDRRRLRLEQNIRRAGVASNIPRENVRTSEELASLQRLTIAGLNTLSRLTEKLISETSASKAAAREIAKNTRGGIDVGTA